MKQKHLLLNKAFFLLLTFILIVSNFNGFVQAKGEEPPEEPAKGEVVAYAIETNSTGIAWGDPNGPHSVYDWPFSVVQMGHVIQSYQNYSSGTSSAYFHHGIDMIAPDGTDVFTRSGGQVVNVENYTAGNDLYWEVAILDPEGYVWQYHHLDKNTIPQLIKDAYAAWKTNPSSGGYVPPNTYIGDIVYWTVTSFGYRFNHIHLNIFGAGDKYLNTLEFHTPLNDNQAPEIQAIGLLNGDTLVSGSVASGNYGLYVRARDLFLSTVYYLPPYKTEFSMDGGPWTTVWEFHDLPGGASDTAYVNDFFVPVSTCGNYTCRDFYIDLGFTTEGQRVFPSTPGQHTVDVRVWDYNGNSANSSFAYNIYQAYENTTATSIPDNGCTSGYGVTKTFNVTEDLILTDVNLGVNISHTRRGQVRVTLKAPNDTAATTIINTASDSYDNYDVVVDDASSSNINDGSNDTVASPYYDRTAGPSTNGSLDVFNGKSSLGTWTVFVCDNTSSTTGTVNRVRLNFAGTPNVSNTPPVAMPQILAMDEDTSLSVTLGGSDAEGDSLTFSVTQGPVHGTLSGTAPALIYTPASDFNSTDSFLFVANDGKVNSNPAAISLTINPVNDTPLAIPQTLTLEEDIATTITLTGSDIDGETLTFSVVTQPAHGILTGTAPELTYTPELDFSGEDNFTFLVNDGTTDSLPALVNLTINEVNDAPLADEQQIITTEDMAVGVILTGSDPEEDALAFLISEQPLHGVLNGIAPILTYTPELNFNGADSFVFVVNDGQVSSTPAVVEISISAINDAPVANAQSIATQQDTPVAIALSGFDVDGDLLSFSVIEEPLNGALSGTAPDLVYTPVVGFIGEEAFSYVVSDGELTSESSQVVVSVSRTNHQPVADGKLIETTEDMSIGIILSASDPDSDPITFRILTPPAHGSLSGTAPDLFYSPEENFNGSDSFTFVANDGLVDSATATVGISITAVNDAPVISNQVVSVAEDASVAITLNGSDVDGDAITFSVTTSPVYGELSGSLPILIYTPSENINGVDSLTFTASDGLAESAVATVDITITPVNDLPTADSQSLATDEDTTLEVSLSGSDIDGDALSFIVTVQPQNGTLSGPLPSLIYTPNVNFNGQDSFSFVANDGSGNSQEASVTIETTPINDQPTVVEQAITVMQDMDVDITLMGEDIDGDEITFSIIEGPVNGTLSGQLPDLVYTPLSGFVGSDSFTYQASDGSMDSLPAVVSITITPSAPSVIFWDDFETDLGWVRNPYGTDTATLGYWQRANPDGVDYYGAKQLGTTVSGSYDLVTGPLAGSSAGSYDLDGGITSMKSPVITLPIGRELIISMSYYLAHYTNSSTADFLRIKVVGSTTQVVFEELGANNDDDAVWESFSADISGFAGQTVYIFIEAGDTNTASLLEAAVDDILIEASAPNNPPVAYEQSIATQEDEPLAVTLSGSDPDGSTLSFSVITQPAFGSLSGVAPELTYIPNTNYNGLDSFGFIVTDGKMESEEASVTISVLAVNDAPIANSQNVSVTQDLSKEISLTGSDSDGDQLTFTVVTQPAHGSLSGTVPELSFTPVSGYIGSDSFTFKVNDGEVDSSEATVNITVAPAGPITVFWDDFEANKGWVRNANGTDTATLGYWERGDPQAVDYYGAKQLGTTVSGVTALVTGPLAGSSAGSYDLDGGITSLRSPTISLPSGRTLTLSLSYYLAHYTNSSTSDFLRIKIVGNTTTTVFEELGANNDDDAVWAKLTYDLSGFAGQTIYILIEAADAGTASLVEAAVDDVLIVAQ